MRHNNNITTTITTLNNNSITNREINNRINSQEWLENYNINVNTNIPSLSQDLNNNQTLDVQGILNINNSTQRDEFITNIINNNNQTLILNEYSNNLNQTLTQTLNENSNLNNFLTSILLNREDNQQLLSLLRDDLNSGNINQLVNHFLNSFLMFLRTSFNGDDELALISFELTLSNIYSVISSNNFENMYNTLLITDSNLDQNNIIELIFNVFNINLLQNRIITDELIENMKNILNNEFQINKEELNANLSDTNDEIEQNKNKAIESLKKLIYNKKFIIFILALIGTSLSGLPIHNILTNLLNNSLSNIDFTPSSVVSNDNISSSSSIQNNEIIRVRDIFDTILKKILENLKNI